MTRNEQQMYSDITSIRKSLEKIANALDNNVTQTTKDIPGFEGTLDALDNLCNVSTKDEEYDFDVHNDYLNDLVQGMNHIEYLQFHDQMNFSFASSDATAMSNAIYELEYDECLGAIEAALLCTGDSDYISAVKCTPDGEGRKYVIDLLEKENTTQPENDIPCKIDGITNDSDYRIRLVASNYEDDYATKKDAILDYVESEFGSEGAKYTDIIKFAYYLGAPNAPKYTSENRGYYSCAFSFRMNGHLIQGGKDYLVKGINDEGKERYFTLSKVNYHTDYWKRIGR